MTQPTIIIKAVSPSQLAIACSFRTKEAALAALEAARAKIASGEVPLQGQPGVIVPSNGGIITG